MENITKLEKDFTVKNCEGWDKPVHFIQLVETETAYLYKREIGKYVDYEVFKKRVRKQLKHIGGKVVELDTKQESYPKAASFGKWAWSFNNLERAYKKLSEI